MLLTVLACVGQPIEENGWVPLSAPLTASQLDVFDYRRVKAVVDELGGDAYAGRAPGSLGHAAAVDWLEVEMASVGLEPAGSDGGYRGLIPLEPSSTRYAPDATGAIVEVSSTEGINLGGLISGSDLSEELIVVMAHHDHLGTTKDGEVYNGSYDDISGVALLLELARVYRDNAIQPRRSLLFLITDMEEGGLQGAEGWVDQAPWPMDQVVVAMSVDPVGRPVLPDTWPLVTMGLERSPALKALFSEMARSWSDAPVQNINRSAIPIFASDQDVFWGATEAVPAVWLTSPGFTWYHTTGDVPETIDYRTLQDHGRFLAQAFLHLADQDTRWVDEGEKQIGPEDALEAVDLIDVLLTSQELESHERSTLGYFQEQYNDLAEQGEDLDTTAAEVLTAETLFYLLDDLAQAHPGEVPPPLPE